MTEGMTHDYRVMVSRRIGLWLCSFVVSVTLVSLLCSLPFALRSFAIILQFTTIVRWFFSVLQSMTILAFPVGVLYLPFVVAFKDAEQRRLWMILASGSLIGPACLAILGLFVQLRGGDAHTIWRGDGGIDIGILQCMPYELGVGVLTAGLYVIGLKVIRGRAMRAA